MFVRVSHMMPKQGQETRLTEVLQKLSAFYREQGGYLGGYVLSPYPGADAASSRFGRVGAWESQDHAEDAAQMEHAMALRAELTRIVDEDSHYEYSFNAQPDNI
ncbi:MAG: hypothetical protein WD800_07565 [Dehalococcoidia bacterium]